MDILKKVALLIVTCLGYLYLGYFAVREEFNLFIGCFSMLFIAYLFVFRDKSMKYSHYWYIAIGVRLLLLFSLPLLSDDYYRFIWDGRITEAGISPFEALPSGYLTAEGFSISSLTKELYDGLNSPNYFTIYPPVCQTIFWLSAKIASPSIIGQVIVMRIFIILVEIITLLGISQILKHFNIPRNNVWLYGMNPLVVIELTGNLHFEALMIAGVVWGLYFLLKNQWQKSALCILFAVNAKLLPLMLLPSIIPHLGFKKASYYYLIIGLGTVMAFYPFMELDILLHLFESINLYFQSFEFNASIYYVLRWLGYQFSGYNLIKYIGPALSCTVLIAILIISWRPNRKLEELPIQWTCCFLIYMLGATIVHPWYILILIALGAVTQYYFAIVWSMVVVLSYSAYRSDDYQENLWLVAIEYMIVISYLCWEIYSKKLSTRGLESEGIE